MASALAGATVAATLGVPAAQASRTPGGFDWLASSYALAVDGSAIRPVQNIGRSLPQGVGYATVDLTHDAGDPQGRCEARGAGYWLGSEIEGGALGGKNMDPPPPPPPGNSGGGYANPTTSREVYPLPPDPGAQSPAVYDYTYPGRPLVPIPHDGTAPVRLAASCVSDVAGSATGALLRSDLGSMGSAAGATLDRRTGRYVAGARAHVADLRASTGAFDAVTSLLEVTLRPGREPVVGYRLSIAGLGAGPADSRFDREQVTLAGSAIPLSELSDHFDDQMRSHAAALSVLGPAGFRLLAPQVDTPPFGDRFQIVAPVLEGHLGLAAREGTIGQGSAVQLAATTFQGSYGGLDLRKATPTPAPSASGGAEQ